MELAIFTTTNHLVTATRASTVISANSETVCAQPATPTLVALTGNVSRVPVSALILTQAQSVNYHPVLTTVQAMDCAFTLLTSHQLAFACMVLLVNTATDLAVAKAPTVLNTEPVTAILLVRHN